MADMFREDDQQDWQHHHDRAAVEHRRVEVRQHKERGSSNRLGNRWNADKPGQKTGEVPGNDRDQDRDHPEEPAEEHLPEHRKPQRDQKDGQCTRVNLFNTDQSRIGSRSSRKFEADQRDHRSHRCRREHNVDPVGAAFVDDKCNDTPGKSNRHIAALRGAEAVRMVLEQVEGGRNEREWGTEVSGGASLGDDNKQQGAETVHEQYDWGIDAEQDWHQHRGTKHGKHMLKAQGKEQPSWWPLVNRDDSFAHTDAPLFSQNDVLFALFYYSRPNYAWLGSRIHKDFRRKAAGYRKITRVYQ